MPLIAPGSTGFIREVFIQDTSSTTGEGLTGLTNATSGLTAYYKRDTDTGSTAISLASATLGTWTSGGFKEVDSTNMKGVYEFGVPNACLASGAGQVVIQFRGATNMAPVTLGIDIGYHSVNLSQALSAARAVDSVADTSLTINDAMHCAIQGAAGQETITGTSYVKKTPSTATTLRTFTVSPSPGNQSRT